MKKIIFSLVLSCLCFAPFALNAQIQSFAVKFTPTTVVRTANTYRIVGQVSDINGILNATNALVGDSLHMVQEKVIYALVLTTKHSASGTLLDATFTSLAPNLVSASPSQTVEGACNLARVNGKGYIAVASGLPNPLSGELENRFKQNVAGRYAQYPLTPTGVTSTGTSSGWNIYEEVNSALSITRTLPAALSTDLGSRITYKNVGNFSINIARNGTDLLNGATSTVSIAVGEAVSFLVVGGGQVAAYSNYNSSSVASVFAFNSLNSNGATVDYFTLTGTPVVTFTKASGVGTLSVTGGTVKWSKVQVDLNANTDVDGSGNFALVVNGLSSTNTAYEIPIAVLIDTKAGVPPSTTNWVYKNQGSAPVLSISASTIGSSITIKSVSALNSVGDNVSLVCKF